MNRSEPSSAAAAPSVVAGAGIAEPLPAGTLAPAQAAEPACVAGAGSAMQLRATVAAPAQAAAVHRAFAQDALGLADLVLVSIPTIETLRSRRDARSS